MTNGFVKVHTEGAARIRTAEKNAEMIALVDPDGTGEVQHDYPYAGYSRVKLVEPLHYVTCFDISPRGIIPGGGAKVAYPADSIVKMIERGYF